MTLQSSGQIKLTQIASEYGDAKPHKLTELYGKPGLPSSGRIDFTDFYGKSAYVAPVEKSISIAGTTVADSKVWVGWQTASTIRFKLANGVTYTAVKNAEGYSTIDVGGLVVSPAPPNGTEIWAAISGRMAKTKCVWGSGTFQPVGGYFAVEPAGACTLTIWYY